MRVWSEEDRPPLRRLPCLPSSLRDSQIASSLDPKASALPRERVRPTQHNAGRDAERAADEDLPALQGDEAVILFLQRRKKV